MRRYEAIYHEVKDLLENKNPMPLHQTNIALTCDCEASESEQTNTEAKDVNGEVE